MYLVGIEESTSHRILQIECERGCGLPVADPAKQEQRPSRETRRATPKNRRKKGALAQLGARHTGSVEVTGSNPVCSIVYNKLDIALLS